MNTRHHPQAVIPARAQPEPVLSLSKGRYPLFPTPRTLTQWIPASAGMTT